MVYHVNCCAVLHEGLRTAASSCVFFTPALASDSSYSSVCGTRDQFRIRQLRRLCRYRACQQCSVIKMLGLQDRSHTSSFFSVYFKLSNFLRIAPLRRSYCIMGERTTRHFEPTNTSKSRPCWISHPSTIHHMSPAEDASSGLVNFFNRAH